MTSVQCFMMADLAYSDETIYQFGPTLERLDEHDLYLDSLYVRAHTVLLRERRIYDWCTIEV